MLSNATACYVGVKYCYGVELETHKWVEWRNLWWLLQFPQTTHLTPSEDLIGPLPKFYPCVYFCNDFVFRNIPRKSCTHLQDKKIVFILAELSFEIDESGVMRGVDWKGIKALLGFYKWSSRAEIIVFQYINTMWTTSSIEDSRFFKNNHPEAIS